jgi:hypothetical protein
MDLMRRFVFVPIAVAASLVFGTASAAFALPDSRGYELVSPADKGDGALSPVGGGTQAAESGDGLAYLAPLPLPDAQTGADNNYLATRGAAGWSSQDLTPPQAAINEGVLANPVIYALSSDLSRAVLKDGGRAGLKAVDSPELVSGEPQNNVNLFARDNGTGGYQLVDLTPPGVTPAYARFEGASPDLSRVLFDSTAQLVPGAPAGQEDLYEWADGSLSLAGVIPVAPATRCGGGGPACIASPQSASLGGGNGIDQVTGRLNAISLDGSKAFFTDVAVNTAAPGQLYVRENGETVEISASQKTNGTGPGGTDPAGPRFPEYWPPSADGSTAFFTSCEQLTNDATANASQSDARCHGVNTRQHGLMGSDLYAYDTASGALSDLTVDSGDPLGADVVAVLGASRDGSYVYFAANGVLAPGASPGNCYEPVNNEKGHCNLYVHHNGSTAFIASIADDASTEDESIVPWHKYSATARVTPDGTRLAFTTTASLTGYDNAIGGGASSCGSTSRFQPLPTGDPHCSEVYLYDAVSRELSCVSCNPSGARPLGASYLAEPEELGDGSSGSDEYLPRTLSQDGTRLFFESEDALVPVDVNARKDVYEYENGHLNLITSGTSNEESSFVDASVSGNDVFFMTSSRLVGQDRDEQPDIYDARVGGGFPFAPAPAPCSDEACRAPATGWSGPALASSGGSGNGNLVPVPVSSGGTRSRSLTRAQKLAGALRACQHRPRRRRASCRARARRLYGGAARSTKSARGSK